MQENIVAKIKETVREIFGVGVEPVISTPEEKFGDYSTNIALQLAKKLGKEPTVVAGQIAESLKHKLASTVNDVNIAGPGFINLKLKDNLLQEIAQAEPLKVLQGKTIVAEYSDPNPFKVLHAGHLYTSVVGDAIANLLEHAGAKVHRVNFGGDVGRHVAVTMWAVLFNETKGDIKNEELAWSKVQAYSDKPLDTRAAWLANYYVLGNKAYETDKDHAKVAVAELNNRIYQLHTDNDHESPFAQIYWTCRQWSYDYFDEFYARIGVKFEKYYPESETAVIGLKTVKEHIGKVYMESEGAVVFKGEKYGLHTRVFINSDGLPTYETKDVGLIIEKWRDYKFDQSIVITGNEIVEYMKVVLKSIEQFMPELSARTRHLTHGLVKLSSGTKMSSRLGNILRATDVLDAAAQASRKLISQDNSQTVLGAVKYAFLKQRLGADIIYNPEESVKLEGNSGPYLQYAYARARSILAKTSEVKDASKKVLSLEQDERQLLRKIGECNNVLGVAVNELAPHHLCNYLYELAQTFNQFYEKNKVIGDKRENIRVDIVRRYSDILKTGLDILGIPTPDKI